MDNKFTKADYEKAARIVRIHYDAIIETETGPTWVSDLLENAITNIETVERYFHSPNLAVGPPFQSSGVLWTRIKGKNR